MNFKKLFNTKHHMSITTLTAVVLFFVSSQIYASDTIKNRSQDSLLLSSKELRDQKKEAKFLQKKRDKEIRDSIRYIKDSIRWSQPRILKTYILEDSMKYKRLITWRHDSYFNSITLISPDTTFNDNYYEYPHMRRDVGAAYLGVAGSATQTHNYFKRERLDIFEPFEVYLPYSNTKETLPFYNVKTPYTELAYWGTLFANRDKEETNIKFMHTQNLSPALNINFNYNRYGGKGLLGREATDNRTLSITSNYLGKRYVMHSGYIFQGVKREENGGLTDERVVLDTTFEDTKDLAFRLSQADNHLKRNTLFLTHSYGVPIRMSKSDTLNSGEGTITYFGHSFELSSYSKKYTDLIDINDTTARGMYNNQFLLSKTSSFDSVRVNNFENRFFIRLQPWAKDAVVSKLDGGLGYQILSIYNFKPEQYIGERSNNKYDNLYLYFGANGNFRKYFRWNAMAKYHLVGYYANNFALHANAGISLYPNNRAIHLTGRLSIENRRPSWFSNNYFSNHYYWNNNFNNITETRLQGQLNIPSIKAGATFGYSVINNLIYYGIQGIAAQHSNLITVMSATLQKNFKIGFLHLDNRVLLQQSSNNEVLPLPAISANLRYYMQFVLVKDVLTAQLGADATFNTKYYAPAYSPALGIFHNQKEREIGNYPYIDAFLNLQWKRTSIFVKYINAAQGWPDSDYFSAHRYMRPQSAIKFGIHWPFYVK